MSSLRIYTFKIVVAFKNILILQRKQRKYYMIMNKIYKIGLFIAYLEITAWKYNIYDEYFTDIVYLLFSSVK